MRGYSCFVPKKLPPDPPLQMDSELIMLLSSADSKLGRLDGVTQILPNPELFVAMYVQKEALLSSQIEGTQASLIDVLNASAKKEEKVSPNLDVGDVVHYVEAMNWGLNQLQRLPLSLRLLRGIHRILLREGRGHNRNPGEFRTSQNWIGAPGSTIETAAFIPPSCDEMQVALGDLELFLHSEDMMPPLIKIAVVHAQFETIHPFLDGNGRMGRLLITFWLCEQGILGQPLLYLSHYFKQNRIEYYDRLTAVRMKGDWEGWIKFFLRGIAAVSDEATASAKRIIALQAELSQRLLKHLKNSQHAQTLLTVLFQNPIVTNKMVAKLVGVSLPTAVQLVNGFVKMGILEDAEPERKRYKKYRFNQYIDILNQGVEPASAAQQ